MADHLPNTRIPPPGPAALETEDPMRQDLRSAGAMRVAADDGMPWISCPRWMHAGGMGGEGKTAPGPRAVPLGQREALADERESLADQRERKADQREVLADERQRLLDDRTRTVAAGVRQLQEQSRVLIERSQALLAGSDESLQPHGAEATPIGGQHQPRQDETGTAAKSDPDAAPLFGPGTPIQRAIVLRTQLAKTLGALAATEEEVARVHDALAEQGARNADHYRHAAAEARSRAVELRDMQKHFRT